MRRAQPRSVRSRARTCLAAACAAAALTQALVIAACQPAGAGGAASLQPTLSFGGAGSIPMQSGLPVPSFSFQPRPRVVLDGAWRFQPLNLDESISFAARPQAVGRLQREAGGRERPEYDDSRWDLVRVPGAFHPATEGTNGGWYRSTFTAPAGWTGQAVTLKVSAANYLADVWLNGRYLGYHEGGSTPFALDATQQIEPNSPNLLAVRIDDPPFGTRNDIVPWGIVDWRNYGGLTGSVWLEATDPVLVARADVTPYLDRADVSFVLENRGRTPAAAVGAEVSLLPAAITADNLLDPDPRHLVPGAAAPLATVRLDVGQLQGQSAARLTASFALGRPDLWLPSRPSLYVVHVSVDRADTIADEIYDTFGVRRIRVDPAAPRLLLNGEPVAFRGVAMQDEHVTPPGGGGLPAGGPVATADDALRILRQVRDVHADFIRTDHRPANPLVLQLADRMGFAVWEEIPLYHFTPETFNIAMGRGIPQQMLSEMDLRDFNRASVLFHGLANESSGQAERMRALEALHNRDRALDGTRLTGQAMYGSNPADSTSQPLDVAAYTFYYGVFYSSSAQAATDAALGTAHRTYPHKPVIALEFGRWSDSVAQDALQEDIFRTTYSAFAAHFDTVPDGYVGGVAWWTLNDYLTDLPGIDVERFGLYRPDGSRRPVAVAAAQTYGLALAGRGPDQQTVSGGSAVPVQSRGAATLLGYLAYGLAVPSLLVALATGLLILARGRRPGGAG